MIQLFKTRTFSDYFSDTISFFKTSGRHFFRNYFIVNGGFMLVLIVLIYFGVTFYIEAIQSQIAGSNNSTGNSFDSLFSQNMPLVIGFIIISFLVVVALSVLNVAYPIIYLSLYDKHQGHDFSTTQIINVLKNNILRLIKFSLGTIFIYLPLFLIILGVCIALCFIIIGIPILLIVFPALYSWLSIAFYDYLTNQSRFFQALQVGYRTVFQDFWAVSGASFLMMMIVQMLQTVVAMIPYIIGVVIVFSSAQDTDTAPQHEKFGFFVILMVIVFALSVTVGYISNNLLVVAQGLMYYSGRERQESVGTTNLIDKIGSDFE
jgi:type III secretory pathway component EscS